MLQTTHLRPHLDELSDQMWTTFFVDPIFSSRLQQKANLRLQMQLFRDAGLAASNQVQSQIRNDKIFWLDAKLPDLSEIESSALHSLDQLRQQIRTDLRVSLGEVECHYAFYEKGHFYKRHRDTTSQNNKRIFSFVLYLNDNWKEDDGGALMAYGNEKILFSIQPEIGKMILFRSELEHEVLITNRDRLSLTGWFRQ